MNPLTLNTEDLQKQRSSMYEQQSSLLQKDAWQTFELDARIESKMMLCTDGRFPVVQATSTVHSSASELFDYLVHRLPETCHEWNDVMYYAHTLHRFNKWAQIGTVISDGKPIADREDLFLQIFDQKDDGTLYEMSIGFDQQQMPSTGNARRSAVRSKLHFCSKKMIPIAEDRCLYRTLWHYDPAGWASRLIPHKIFGKIVLKNLVHEHQRIHAIFAANKD